MDKSQKIKTLQEIKGAVIERINNPEINPDFNGIYDRLNSIPNLSKGGDNYYLGENEIVIDSEERRDVIASKIANYMFYTLGHEQIEANQIDSLLKEDLERRAFGVRNNLEKEVGRVASLDVIGDTSEQDWGTAQNLAVNHILHHYGTILSE